MYSRLSCHGWITDCLSIDGLMSSNGKYGTLHEKNLLFLIEEASILLVI